MLKKISALLLAVAMLTVSMCACTSKEELETANADLESAKNDLTSVQTELDDTKTELETTKTELDTTSKELETTKEDLDKVNAKLANINAKIDIADTVALINKEIAELEIEYPSIFNEENYANYTSYPLGEIVDGEFVYNVFADTYDGNFITNIRYASVVYSDDLDELKDILLKEIYHDFAETVTGEITTDESVVQNMESLSKGEIELDISNNYTISYKTDSNNSVGFSVAIMEANNDAGKYMLGITVNCQEYFEVQLRK